MENIINDTNHRTCAQNILYNISFSCRRSKNNYNLFVSTFGWHYSRCEHLQLVKITKEPDVAQSPPFQFRLNLLKHSRDLFAVIVGLCCSHVCVIPVPIQTLHRVHVKLLLAP